jgi:hypothetical protein
VWTAPGLLAALLGVGAAAGAGAVELGPFAPPSTPTAVPDGWEPLVFQKVARTTRYTVVRDGDGWVIQADSEAAASALYRPLDVDARAYPRLTWRWKVANVLAGADARRKSGDDASARVYVAFRYDAARATAWERLTFGAYRLLYGRYPPAAVVSYIWDNRLPPGTALDNAYTDRARMLVLRSGAADVGRWVMESRDVVEDYRRLFGGEPPRIAGVAVMTDTDDTGERAVAWYDALALRARE